MSTLETLVTKKLIENNKYLFFFLPIFLVPLGIEYFEIPKYYFLIFFSLFFLINIKFKEIKFSSLVTVSFFFYLFISTISSGQIFFKESFFGIDFIRYNSLLFLYILLVFFLFYQQKKFPKNFLSITETYLLVGVFITAVVGILQFLIKPFNLISETWYFDGRIVSTMGHPNFLASILVIGLIIAKRVKLVWVQFTLILALILTFSKTSIILYFLYLLIEYIFNLYKVSKKIAVTLAITCLLFIFSISLGLFADTYRELISNKPEMYQFQRFFVFLNPSEVSLDLRFKIWSEALLAISDSPYFGFGKGQVIRIIALPEFGDLMLSSTHNLYLDVAVESGLLGLTAFLIFIVASLINSYKYDKYLFLIQLFIAIHGLFDITHVSLWFIFIFISGISINKFNKDYLKQV